MTKRALLTGITGQDGAYLAQLLLSKGYEVSGVIRRSSHRGVEDHRLRWLGVANDVQLLDGDLSDLSSLLRIVQEVKPDEVYNLAAQSFVASSWRQPILTANITAVAVAKVLEALRLGAPGARFYQASSSEMYGLIQEPMQSERRPSIRARLTPSPSSTAIGSRSITARASACTPPRAFSSIMRARCAA